MLKVKREGGTRRCFAEVSESRHSPLVLIGAPAQGCSPPWSVQGSSVLYELIFWHSVVVNHPQPLTTWVGSSTSSTRWSPSSPITTKLSRWWRSPRVTSTNSHLTMTSLMRRVDAHFATLAFTNEASLLDSQITITSLGPCSSWHSQGCFSTVWMSKNDPLSE